MGALTFAQVVSAGLAKAGTPTARQTIIETEFKAWLRDVAADWPWPWALQRFSAVALASGSRSLFFGNDAPSSLTPKVVEVRDPIFIYNADYTTQQHVRVRTVLGGAPEFDEHAADPAVLEGTPCRVKVRASTVAAFQWELVFDVVADEDYLLAIDAHIIPDDPASGEIPLYPNDSTLIKAVEVLALHDRKADNYMMERDVLTRMVVNDRSTYGTSPGFNVHLGLDPTVFR